MRNVRRLEALYLQALVAMEDTLSPELQQALVDTLTLKLLQDQVLVALVDTLTPGL